MSRPRLAKPRHMASEAWLFFTWHGGLQGQVSVQVRPSENSAAASAAAAAAAALRSAAVRFVSVQLNPASAADSYSIPLSLDPFACSSLNHKF
eukprot:COSAG04_NODE_2322_length_4333_cov_7.621871_7_plen_93_part_00